MINFPKVVMDELNNARDNFPKFNTPHEGYAVLLEEVDELWFEIKKNEKKHPDRNEKMRKEAIQVAAMALRFLLDCCEDEQTEQVEPFHIGDLPF